MRALHVDIYAKYEDITVGEVLKEHNVQLSGDLQEMKIVRWDATL